MRYASTFDYREHAKQKLSAIKFEYLEGYAEDGVAKESNELDFEKIKLKQRGMMNVETFKGSSITLFGHSYASPAGISPVSHLSSFCHEGELAVAAAAK